MYQSVMGLSNSHHPVSDHQLLPKNIAAMPRYIASSISTNSSSSKVWLSFSSNTPVFLRVTWSKKKKPNGHIVWFHTNSQWSLSKRVGLFFFVTRHWPWQSMQTMITRNLGKNEHVPLIQGLCRNFRGLPKFCFHFFMSRNETTLRYVSRNLAGTPLRTNEWQWKFTL